ncbi:hypothetical protein ACPXCE_06045 [Streptomyces sp. DT24]
MAQLIPLVLIALAVYFLLRARRRTNAYVRSIERRNAATPPPAPDDKP